MLIDAKPGRRRLYIYERSAAGCSRGPFRGDIANENNSGARPIGLHPEVSTLFVTRDQIFDHFKMTPHPEGGAFVENYRSDLEVSAPGFPAPRRASTGIYFLLDRGEFSAFHRIRSDETWHFYLGGPLHIVEIDHTGRHRETILGRDIHEGQNLTHVVKAGHWFASYPSPESDFSLVGCTVAPGFDFQDFELADRRELAQRFPEHAAIIARLTADRLRP